MSTRGRSFGISKKREAGALTLTAALLWAVLGLFQTTCIVTDEIKFEDAVDYPPEVLSITPAEQLVPVCIDSSEPEKVINFTVKVWEPDKETTDESELDAGYIVYRDLFSGTEEPRLEECKEPEELSDESASMEAGIVENIECLLSIPMFYFDEYPLIPITIIISDKGFKNDVPKTGAHTVEVYWVLEAEECF